jgi:hypothetical protein
MSYLLNSELDAPSLSCRSDDLELAAQHVRVAARHLRVDEVPRSAAHAWAAHGHELAARELLRQDEFDGIAALEWSRQLLSHGESALEQLREALLAMDTALLQRERVVLSVTAETAVCRQLRPVLEACLSECVWSGGSPTLS